MRIHDLLEMRDRDSSHAFFLSKDDAYYSYSKTWEMVQTFAVHLETLKVGKGSRVLIAIQNSPEFFISYFAVVHIGAIAVPISHKISAKRLKYIISDCCPESVITSLSPDFVINADLYNCVKNIIVCTESSAKQQMDQGIMIRGFSEIISNTQGFHSAYKVIDLDPAMIIYTSGSTGVPKGILCSHLNVISAARSIVGYLRMARSDKIIQMLPPFFDYGLYQAILCAYVGAELTIVEDSAFPDIILSTIESKEITGIPLVPSLAASLLRYIKSCQKPGTPHKEHLHVRFISNTGASFHPKYFYELKKHFPNAQIYSMYGLSECKRVSYLDPSLFESKPYSVGKAMDNVQAWIADDNGTPLPPGQVGVLNVRGSNVALGYWNDPGLSEKVFRKEQYDERVLVTNDLFYQDNEGFLYFQGRNDDVIKSGAYRISLKEVTDIILSIDGVSEAVVVPLKHEDLEFVMKAVIVLEPGVNLPIPELRQKIRSQVDTSLMVPAEIEYVLTLPKTDTGKIDKTQLKA